MSLYYEAASILTDEDGGGSLKSRIYNDTTKFKSRPAQLYALITETAKYDSFLTEVIEKADILKFEPKLTPLLSLLLVHDYLFSAGNIAASKDHPLKLAILRHKARLSSEFTKARIHRKCATIAQLKVLLAGDRKPNALLQPRWARLNTLKADQHEVVQGCSRQPDLFTLMTTYTERDGYHIDEHIPNLIAFPPGRDLTKMSVYKDGKIILQDKASCFPAYLLLGDEDSMVGDVIDACAAPGNKTTHMASILRSREGGKLQQHRRQIFACERDPRRSDVLREMVNVAGAEEIVTLLPRQDFFALDPDEKRFKNVTHLLLDPTCSGSGIVGREDVPKLKLPKLASNGRKKVLAARGNSDKDTKLRERKRGADHFMPESRSKDEQEEDCRDVDQARLEKLSDLQTRIVLRAMSFPAARRITYSTCSVLPIENEIVVSHALGSEVARKRGWRVLRREEQVKGLREWEHRGIDGELGDRSSLYSEVERLACIRCHPDTVEGTMGFFVCCFIRDDSSQVVSCREVSGEVASDEFDGFDDWG